MTSLFKMARRTDPDTSWGAASDVSSKVDTHRALVLKTLRSYPHGLTDFELGDLLGLQQTSAGKRRGELRDSGLVEDSGKRRPAPSGSLAIVWRARTSLYKHQEEAARFLHKRKGRAALLMKMRTGKTRATLAYLADTPARRILVVCPKSAAYVWRNELRAILPEAKASIIVDMPNAAAGENKVRRAAEADATVYLIVNWEVFWRYPPEDKRDRKAGRVKAFPLRGVRKAILRWFKPDTLIWDEAQRLKRRSSKQSRFANQLEPQPFVRRAIALTGTAVTEGIEDLFGIYRAIDKGVFGSNYADFDRRYVIRGGYGGFQIKGYRNEAEVRRKLALTAFQYEGPPDDIEDVIVPVVLGTKTKRAYDQMKKDAIAEIEGTDEEGHPLRGIALSRIVLTNLLRLQQLTGGFITTDKGPIQVGDDKLKAALELTADSLDSGRRVVIFCRFLNEMKRLAQKLPKAGIIDGSVPAADREREIEALRSGQRDVLIVQIRAGGIAVDLSGASVEIFYSMGYSLTDFLQARARLLGPRQTSSVTSYILQAKDSIDEKVFEALTDKQAIARRVTSLEYAKGLFG